MAQTLRHAAQLAQLSSQVELPALARLAVAFATAVTTWDHNWRSRKVLKALEPHELSDVGLSRAEARREANKRFYQR